MQRASSSKTKVNRPAYRLHLVASDSLRITLMKSIGRRTLHSHGLLSARLATLLSALLIAILLSSTAFAWQGGAATGSKRTNTLTEAERKATGRIKLESIREITTKLSSKELKVWARASLGPITARISQIFLRKFGLKPAG